MRRSMGWWAFAGLALAHGGGPGGLVGGLLHPFTGLDHLAAMFILGVWAAQLGGVYLWRLPLGFLAFAAMGWLLGFGLGPWPGVEVGILASLLLLGGVVAGAARLPLPGALALVGASALGHGYAHGAETPLVGAWGFALGFLLSTLLLHLGGMALGLALGTRGAPGRGALRFLGSAVVVLGLALALGG
ncbi:HupE/UreJ family protein [Thermus scotoductus]|uniref:HupE/UreJ family protein n=1 Tax=Thermus scotoductus TaxID=37636 RepID=UPI000F7FB6C1|nr:HupE/UreJ family protein [Thermus scotoductus]RTI03251.1 hypothetical protein CSW28_00325 [Thermus scotoductus]